MGIKIIVLDEGELSRDDAIGGDGGEEDMGVDGRGKGGC
jgi:hypothetical protein